MRSKRLTLLFVFAVALLAGACRSYNRAYYETLLDSGRGNQNPDDVEDVAVNPSEVSLDGSDAAAIPDCPTCEAGPVPEGGDAVATEAGLDADASGTMPEGGPPPVDVYEAGPDNGCNPARIPSRPAGAPDVDGGTTSIVFVARRINFGFESPTLWGQHGYDRDGLCTDPARPGRAMGPCRPRGTSAPPADGIDGRDNSFAPRLGAILAGAGWTENSSNDGIAQGNASIAIRLRGYGGGRDDAQLLAEWFPVVQGHRPDNRMALPAFDGRDVWHINEYNGYDTATAPPNRLALIRSDRAYVSNGNLVMALPSRSVMRFEGSRFPVRLTLSGGTLGGPITPEAAGPMEFSGWWPLNDALNDINSVGICPTDPILYQFVYGALQGAADLLSTGDIAPSIDCDSISIGFGVEFVRATLGEDVNIRPANENPCM